MPERNETKKKIKETLQRSSVSTWSFTAGVGCPDPDPRTIARSLFFIHLGRRLRWTSSLCPAATVPASRGSSFLRLSSAEAPECWYSWKTDCYRGLGLETRPRKVPSAAVSWCWRTTLVPCSGSHNKNPAITILIIIIVPSGGTPHRGLLKKGESAGNRTDGKWKVEDHEESQELSWCTTSSSSEERRGLTLMKTRSRRKKRSSTGKPNMPNGNNKNGAQSI